MSLDLGWLEATMLAGVRMAVFLVIAPPFSGGGIPLQVKGILAIGLAVAVAPRVTAGYTPLDTGPFLLALIAQVLAGALLGFLVMLVFSAIQSAGGLIDLFGGFSLAQAFDPQSMVNGAQFARLMHMVAIGLLFASGGYELILGGLVRTFDAVPVSGAIDFGRTGGGIIGGLTQMFLGAVQIAGPILVVLFLADIGLALLTRVAPQMNAFALGFPLKILVTLVVAGVVFLALPRVVGALVEDGLRLMGVSS